MKRELFRKSIALVIIGIMCVMYDGIGYARSIIKAETESSVDADVEEKDAVEEENSVPEIDEIEEIDSLEAKGNTTVESENVEGETITIKYNLSDKTTSVVQGVPVNTCAFSLPNWVYMSIKPQASSYKITVYNVGIDAVDKIPITCKVYKNSGALIASSTHTFKNVLPGAESWTWKLSKGETVQESIKVTGKCIDGHEQKSFSGSTVRYNFAGGKYGTMSAYDGQRHHMPSNSVNGLSTYSGPCLRMITSEHKKTASYGNSASAQAFRKKEKKKVDDGKFLAAQKLGINDIRDRFGYKYNKAINNMVSYTKSLGYNE